MYFFLSLLSLFLSLLAFLIGVDSVTGFLAVVPCASKNTDAWYKAIKVMMETKFPAANLILSDRDSVASKKFVAEIYKLYHVDWAYLAKGAKAFLGRFYLKKIILICVS